MKIANKAKYAVVKTYKNRVEAEIGKGLLASNKVKAFVSADDAGGMYPPLRGVKLLVSIKDFDKAGKILAS